VSSTTRATAPTHELYLLATTTSTTLFGTLERLDELTAQLHARDMKLVMDLVVNHTSSAHAWFVKLRSSTDKLNARPSLNDPRSCVVSAKVRFLVCTYYAPFGPFADLGVATPT
jgi:hypothetical protein